LATTGDAHLSQYISEFWQSRAWLSGFRGSAGNLLVTAAHAGLWVDPRYHMRADTETADTPITVYKEGAPGTPSLTDWMVAALPAGTVVGFEPDSVSAATLLELKQKLKPAGVIVRPTAGLLDAVWVGRPRDTPAPLVSHPLEFAGEPADQKLAHVRQELARLGAQSMLVTGQDEVAWLLNLRGSDVPLNPVALAYCVINEADVQLFVHVQQVTGALRDALPADVQLRPYGDVAAYLRALPAERALLLDPARTNVALYEAALHTCLLPTASPIDLMKARKNATEVAGSAAAHLQDGVAITRLLHWLATADLEGETELSVTRKLEEFRADRQHYQGPSFGTIAGYGPNSAVGHYKLNAENPQPISRDAILLIDCGGQYLTGTTDTTRTVSLGDPTREQVIAYTAVLRSLIMTSAAKFPKGTVGQRLDAIARYHLWSRLWECRHGIGHGVGSYLHVHEGPQRINKTNDVPFEPGMMNSCEPGIYFEGDFGVRLENVIVTAPAGENGFGEFYQFDTMTLCPFERELIDPELMSREEVAWLDAYHQRVYEEVGPLLGEREREWLRGRTAAF
jgi:Xaa-Pro aminopeptidase